MSPPYVVILAGRFGSLVRTIECARSLAPRSQILVVSPARTLRVVRAQLAAYRGIELLVPPRGFVTGPADLFALSRVLARAPLANVVFLPTESSILDPAVVVLAAHRALSGNAIQILGLPDQVDGAPRWTIFMSAGRVTAYWDLARRHVPVHAWLFEDYVCSIGTPDEHAALDFAYARTYHSSLHRALLATPDVELVPLPPDASALVSVIVGRYLATAA